MKKQLLLVIITCIGFSNLATAQEKKERPNKAQTDMGKWFVQTDMVKPTTTTSFRYNSSSDFATGISGGYFIKKNLAITTAFGYDKKRYGESLSYKLGAKYYFKNNLFLTADIGATHINRFGGASDYGILKTGVDFGYAWFIGKYLSIEPSLRTQYESDKFGDFINLNLNLGFSVHF